MQASAPRLLTLASGAVSAMPALPAAGPASHIRWLSNAQLLAWGAGHPPIIVGLDGAREVVKLPPTSWDGSRVDLRGERASIATSSGLVAVLKPRSGDHLQILRAPDDDARFKLHSVQLDPSGRRVLTLREGERSTEVGLFDTAGEPPRLLSTPGQPMFAAFSGDGSQVAWSNEDIAGDMAGGALFPSFTTFANQRADPAHALDETFLGWSGSRMLVHANDGACLRVRHRSLFCRDQSWAPFPETHRAGNVLWVGGDHPLRADARESRVTELHVTGTVERPVLNVIEHPVDPTDPAEQEESGAVQGGTSESGEVRGVGP